MGKCENDKTTEARRIHRYYKCKNEIIRAQPVRLSEFLAPTIELREFFF